MSENGDISPNRPPCAVALSSALEKEPRYESERIILLDAANESAQKASPSDCANCLGRLGVDIVCPLPGAQHDQDTKVPLTFSKFTEIEKELGVYQGRFIRILKGKVQSHIPAFDVVIKAILNHCGIAQKTTSLKQFHLEHPGLGESNEYTQTQVPLPEHNDSQSLRNNGKNDNPPTNKPPRCAGLLIKFYSQRERIIEGWAKDNKYLPIEKRPPIDHTKDEATYQEAIDATAEASIEDDCPECLGENCPINNRTGAKVVIEPKRLYDRTHKKSTLEDGTKIRTSEVVVEITRVGRSGITVSHLDKTDQKLENLGQKSLKRSA